MASIPNARRYYAAMPTLDKPEAEKLLAPFLAANPYSKIEETTFKQQTRLVIQKPWGDASLAIGLQGDTKTLAAALNQLVLPPRFSALWHGDTKDFEVIFTAWKLAGSYADMIGRKFVFNFGKRDYTCEFSDSSARLLTIARDTIHISGSDTGHRNLLSFEMFANSDPDIRQMVEKPFSFWIRNVGDWDEDRVVDLAYHVNFYMSYFDDATSKMIIHPTTAVTTVKPQTRYIDGKFPQRIRAKTIDPNILHFWGAAHGADDQAKSFLYYYRLIEYASTSFMEEATRATVRRLLAQPNVMDDISALTEQLVLAAQSSKKDDEQRIVHLLEETIDKKVLWREIENNIDLFNKNTDFEGGFTLEPLIPARAKIEQLEIGKFCKHTKDIRNALSHGRDIRTQQVIIPTKRNFDLLQPWVTLMCIAAGQVVLFKSV